MSCSADTSDFLESRRLLLEAAGADVGGLRPLQRICPKGAGMGCILNNREHRVVCDENLAGGETNDHHYADAAATDQNGLQRARDGILMMDSSKCQMLPTHRLSARRSRPTSFLALLFRGGRRAIQSVKIEASDESSGSTECGQSARKHLKREPYSSSPAAAAVPAAHTKKQLDEQIQSSTPVILIDLPTNRKRKSLHPPGEARKMSAMANKSPVPLEVNEGKGQKENTLQRLAEVSSSEQSSIQHQRTPDGSTVPDDVTLFTSIHQLCYDIVNKTLLCRLPHSDNGRVLCLFLFGCRGSSKGEIAFKLVDHSAMAKTLAAGESAEVNLAERDCPLYHHMDVAAVVAANIDARIREFNQLVALTARYKREQLALLNKDTDKNQSEDRGSTNSTCDDNSDRVSPISELAFVPEQRERASISSVELSGVQSTGSSNGEEASEAKSTEDIYQCHQPVDDFDLITPSTQQRSILQLKLMKYSNSVTPKWVFGLIERQVENLERQLMEKLSKNKSPNHPRLPDRVYLINLVPNQLSLFKSCLYLKQEIFLKDFKYRYQAIKFEPCTNIKLLTKERAMASESGSPRESFSVSRTLGITHLRLPLLTSSAESTKLADAGKSSGKESTHPRSANEDQSNLAAIATTALADGVNEKLGPRLNETFAQQFKALNRLIQVRYNQMHDYNYASHLEGYESSWRSEADSRQQPSCSSYLQYRTTPAVGPEPRCWSSCDHNRKHHTSSSNHLKPEMSRQLSSSMQELQQLSWQPPATNAEGSLCRLSLSNFNVDQTSSSTGDLHHLASPGSQVSYMSSNSSIATGLTSGDSDANTCNAPVRPHQQRTGAPSGSALRSGQHIASAVELELFDSSRQSDSSELAAASSKLDSAKHRWRGSSSQVNTATSHHDSDHHQQVNETHSLRLSSTHHQEAKHRSPPPLIFSNHQHRVSAASHYQLVPKRIVYANEQTQVLLEVRRVHPRPLKLKAASDLAKLHKLAAKVNAQLEADCEGWLFEEISKQHSNIEERRRGYLAQTAAIGSHLSEQAPLIVFTVRVDVRRLKSGHFQYPADFDLSAGKPPDQVEESIRQELPLEQQVERQRKLVPILKLSEASSSDGSVIGRNENHPRRSLSAQGSLRRSQRRSAGARSGTSSTQPPASQRSERRVQFRLCQAPITGGRFHEANELTSLRPQRRLWISAGLFLSDADQSGSRLMDQVMALMRLSATAASATAAAASS